MREAFDSAAAAALLAEAWRKGTLLRELPAALRPANIDQGYDIQDRLVESLGQTTVGWKLGVGSHAQKRQSGIGRSIAGRVLMSRLYRDGSTIDLPNAAPVTLECEIAYVLGRDVSPDGPAASARDVISETRITFELVLSRFFDRRAVGWPSFAADNAGFHALVVGAPIDPADIPRFVEDLVVTLDGREIARSVSGEDATDPLAALADLLAIARERGMTLPKGSIISTGTVSKPFTVAAPSAEIAAKYLNNALSVRICSGPSSAPFEV